MTVEEEIEKKLDAQYCEAMALIHLTERHVLGLPSERKERNLLNDSKRRKLKWMREYVTKHRWMPASFVRMCHHWVGGRPDMAMYGILDYGTWIMTHYSRKDRHKQIAMDHFTGVRNG